MMTIIIITISIIMISNSEVFWIKNQAYSLSHHKDFSHQYKHIRYFNLIYYCLGGRDVIDPSSVEAPIEVKKVRHMNRRRVWTWIWIWMLMLLLMLMLMRHAVDILYRTHSHWALSLSVSILCLSIYLSLSLCLYSLSLFLCLYSLFLYLSLSASFFTSLFYFFLSISCFM